MKMIHATGPRLLILVMLFPFCVVTRYAATAAVPRGTVDVGDSPISMSFLPGGRRAMVVNLYPEPAGSPSPTNAKIVDFISMTKIGQLQIAQSRRLIAVAAIPNSSYCLFVNEDDDYIYAQEFALPAFTEAAPGSEDSAPISLRVGNRPSNVIVISPTLAMITNGTSGDVSFVRLDLENPNPSQKLRLLGSTKVGSDPRAAALHPTQQVAYVALGGDNAVAVVDLVTYSRVNQAGAGTVNGNIRVGKNPVAIVTLLDGQRRPLALIANVTGNTVSVLDLTNARAPRVVLSPAGFYEIPAGVQPGSIAVSPDGRFAYVANQNINYLTVISLDRLEVAGVLYLESGASCVRISPDGKWLLVTELKNSGRLLVFDREQLLPTLAPAFDVPGEPSGTFFLGTDPKQGCPGFYIAETQLLPGAQSGFWGMEVLATAGDRLLQGGFNLGGGFDANGGNPGFGAFNISNPTGEKQNVRINVQAQALPTTGFRTSDLGLNVRLLRQNADGTRTQIGNTASGPPPLNLSQTVESGFFYIVEMRSLPNSPRGTFQMSLETSLISGPGGGFQGGVVVGGYLTRDAASQSQAGFGAFCISQSQDINVRVYTASRYGDAAAGDILLTIRDRNKNAIHSVDNSLPTASVVAPPAAPDLLGMAPTMTVNATAPTRAAGDCDRSRRFRSLSAAINCANENEVIRVESGIYSPTLTGETVPIGSPGPGIRQLPAGVKIIGQGAATTIIDAEQKVRDGNGNGLVVPGGAHRVRIAGLTIRNARDGGLLVANADNVLIDRNFVTSNARVGIGAMNARGVVLKENVAVANEESGIIVAGALSTATATFGAPANCASPYGACIFGNVTNSNRADGILASQGGNVMILKNTAFNNGSSGIELNNRSDGQPLPELVGTIRENLVSNNGGKQFGFAGTGILVTEGSRAAAIAKNTVVANRPYGIGVFLNGAADAIVDNKITGSQFNALLVQRSSTSLLISGNTITGNGLSGIFVENHSRVTQIKNNTVTGNGTCTDCTFSKAGLAVLDTSIVDSVEDCNFDNNYLGLEVAGSSQVKQVLRATFDRNANGGVLVREGSTLAGFADGFIRNNRGQAAVQISASAGDMSRSIISENDLSGLTFAAAARFTLQDNSVESNNKKDGGSEGGGGIQLEAASDLLLIRNTIAKNFKNGILAAGNGTRVVLNAGNSIVNNLGFGASAYQGAVIECRGANTISGNSGGDKAGNVTGCQ